MILLFLFNECYTLKYSWWLFLGHKIRSDLFLYLSFCIFVFCFFFTKVTNTAKPSKDNQKRFLIHH